MLARRVIAAVLAVAATAGAWMLLAPTRVGGSLTYVAVRGQSMHPGLRSGDLALVRASDRYAVGDVVAYRSDALGAVVLHRILEQRGERYVLRGDANDAEDLDRPRREDIIGSLWVRVPGAGSLVSFLGTPLGIGVLVLLGVAGWGWRAGRAPPRFARPTAIAASAALAALAALALAGGVVAFVLPVSRVVDVGVPFEHRASLSYGATVDRSSVYPEGRVADGDPVYLRLVPRLDVEIAYGLDVEASSDLRGTASLAALLADGAGWERRFPLGEAIVFRGGTARLTGTLNLEQLTAVARAVGDLTGVRPPSYSLTLIVDAEVSGTVGGVPFRDRRQVPSAFTLEPLMLVASEAPTDGVQGGHVRVPRARPTNVGLGALGIDVASLRVIAPVLLVLASLSFVIARREDEPEEALPRRLAATLVHVEPLAGPSVDVASLAELVRLADHTGAVVLAERSGGGFAVQHEGTTYRFAAARNGHA